MENISIATLNKNSNSDQIFMAMKNDLGALFISTKKILEQTKKRGQESRSKIPVEQMNKDFLEVWERLLRLEDDILEYQNARDLTRSVFFTLLQVADRDLNHYEYEIAQNKFIDEFLKEMMELESSSHQKLLLSLANAQVRFVQLSMQ